MVAIATQTNTSISPVFGEATLQDLRISLHGSLLLPNDPGYDDVRQLWNAMIDRRPALIVRCADASDVVAGIQFARTHGLLLAVRGGGHSVSGLSTCDDGLMLDLSLMKGVQVDPFAQTVRAEPGVLLGELDAATQLYGMSVPAGQISHTGIAGLTLGGGIGWLMRKHGLTIDNLRAVELVTADGRQLRASETENRELFWGLRGGGGNFGVVTAFEYQLQKVGPMVLAGPLVYTLDKAEPVMRHWVSFMDTAPDDMASFAILAKVPPQAPFPRELWGRKALIVDTCYAGDMAEGEQVMQPLREFGEPDLDLIGPMPFVVRQSMLDASAPHGLQYYEKSHYLKDARGAIQALLHQFPTAPGPRSNVVLGAMGGAVARVSPDATAFGHRDAPYIFWAIGVAEPGEPIGPAADWIRTLHAATVPFSTGGAYVNSIGNDSADRVRDAYRPEVYERLVALKNEYDPTNFFRRNLNIAPTRES